MITVDEVKKILMIKWLFEGLTHVGREATLQELNQAHDNLIVLDGTLEDDLVT